jgi:photosystem II stability/assembly factor-like uncharacterized protein
MIKSDDGGDNWYSIAPEFPDDGLPHTVGMIRIDPLTPDILYMIAGGFAHTLYKSIDGGLHWESYAIESEHFTILEIEIDLLTPTTLYANLENPWPDSLYTFWAKSTDGGRNWERTFEPPDGTFGRNLAIDPITPATLYAGTNKGIYKSTNGGEEWYPINTGLTELDASAIYIDPTTPQKLYALVWNGAIFKSVNGGGLWEKIIPNLLDPRWMELAIDPTTPNVLFAGTKFGVYRSADGGWTWTAMNDGLTTLEIKTIIFDPSNPSILYAGTGSGIYTMHLSG